MDSITQAALGASLASAVAGKTLGRSALLVGAVLGTLPDLDVIIDYGTAVANFTQHRGFSHCCLSCCRCPYCWLLHSIGGAPISATGVGLRSPRLCL